MSGPRLTPAQQRELNRIAGWEGWSESAARRNLSEFPAPGFPDNMAGRALLKAGLIEALEHETAFLPGISMTVRMARPTAAGWAAATNPPTAEQRRFLSRRVGGCVSTYELYLSVLHRGWVEPVETWNNGGMVKWKRTPAGLAASKASEG